ncbi:MAG: nucleotide sugar dehydrogenase [Candidatus Kaelpia aquatica]|nr:nucleotide sugar dehydrogenase [Candidatus Kaelpia aquatica]
MRDLKRLILKKDALISIIGLGYVGLPLAVEFAKKGYNVCGIDIDKERVKSINRGKSYLVDVDDKILKTLVKEKRLKAGISYNVIAKSDAVIISVPTPLRKTQEPDISYVIAAAEELKKYLKKNTIVVLESTTYPGTTEEIILPLLSKGGLKVGRDFYLAFSPERIDPANKRYNTKNIPKVVGGCTKRCLEVSKVLYAQVVGEVVAVSSPRVAEMVKLLENSFRAVNIALANEAALICQRMGIDVWEVIKAAESKPFGYMPFYPGPGIGGHCIPADPMYLVWKSRLSGYEPDLIRTAHKINSSMPQHILKLVKDALKERKIALKSAKVLIVGVSYKADVNDIRESPAIEIMRLLDKSKVKVEFYDPLVKELKLKSKKQKSINLNTKKIAEQDAVIIATVHSSLDYNIFKKATLLVDTRGVIKWKGKNLIRI